MTQDHSANVDDFYFVGSIGRERFQMSENRCAGEEADWKQIKDLQKRELYDRHIRRFDLCPHGTAELARRALATLALSSDDPIDVTVAADKSVTDCDRLAASPLDMDRARPPGTGVVTEKLDAEAAIDACNKAVNQKSAHRSLPLQSRPRLSETRDAAWPWRRRTQERRSTAHGLPMTTPPTGAAILAP